MRNSQPRPLLVRLKGEAVALQPLALTEKLISERWLQELLHEHPECLPVAEIEPWFSDLVSICMELPTKHGPIDNFLMTPNGDLVLVEAKLWRNQEARRKVVAQALDYASCLFEWSYEELEQAILKSSFGGRKKPNRLYDLFGERDTKAEGDFVDAVNANLRNGRALILVVGDGIRSEARRLTALLESHAGAHFTFALVEMSVFHVKGDGTDFLVYPRIFLETEMIPRGIVEIHDKRTAVLPPRRLSSELQSDNRTQSLTSEHFLEAMTKIRADMPDSLQKLIAALEPL